MCVQENGIKSLNNTEKVYRVLHYLCVFTVVFSALYAILPMLILRENYCFTVWDELDQYAAWVKLVRDKHIYFNRNQPLPVMNGINGIWMCLSYNLRDFLCCNFGYVPGRILARIIEVVLGFFSMRFLLQMLFKEHEQLQDDAICLAAIAYSITPIAPNREIAFAALPATVALFLCLAKKDKWSCWTLLALAIPVFSTFNAALVFEAGIWFGATIIFWVKDKKLNKNLAIGFGLICVSTVFIYPDYFRMALVAYETNRNLLNNNPHQGFIKLFKDYLMEAPTHAPTLHRYIIFPFCVLVFAFMFGYYLDRKIEDEGRLKTLLIGLFCLLAFWIFAVFVAAFYGAGYRIGIGIINGFQWSRIIAFTRLSWYIIFVLLMFLIPKKRILYAFFCVALMLQLIVVGTSRTKENDTAYSVAGVFRAKVLKRPEEISFNEFFSQKFFEEIKSDMKYKGEVCAAYGFEPSVLTYNGFNNIDGYMSVHPMEWQVAFREIIAPELEHNPFWQNYYDTWGGRMYICGELSGVTRDKNVVPTPLHINCDSFKKYGCKYILSRAPISNAEDISLDFVKDYDRDDSLYHIWLYEAR